MVHEHSQYTGCIDKNWLFKEEETARKWYVEMVLNYDIENESDEYDMDDWKNYIDPHKHDCVQVDEDGNYVEIYEIEFED